MQEPVAVVVDASTQLSVFPLTEGTLVPALSLLCLFFGGSMEEPSVDGAEAVRLPPTTVPPDMEVGPANTGPALLLTVIGGGGG